MQILIYVIVVPLGLYVLLCSVLFIFQAHFLYFPDSHIAATPMDVGLSYRPVRFHAKDGVRLAGWFVPAGDSKTVLLFCHGNAGNISHRLESIKIFNELGLSVFIFDYRGYGESSGKPTEQGTYLDAEAAWDVLRHQYKCGEDRIVIFGRSLGGAIAAHLAANRHPAALIVESTFTSVPELASKLYPIFPTSILSRFRYNTEDYIAQVTCPVLIVHSVDDEIVPFDLGSKLYGSAKPPKEFLRIEGSHNNGFVISGLKYREGLKKFLDQYVFGP